MSQKAIENDKRFGNKIKERRQSLNLTIEQAARLAGVGTKTWSRYEAGEPIRADKYKAICKVLKWSSVDYDEDEAQADIDEYKDSPLWSSSLEEQFGPEAAFSFAVGSDLVLDIIEQDLETLASMPKGAHIGMIDISELKDRMPTQFLPFYDYDFIYYMKTCLIRMQEVVRAGGSIVAHTVVEEILMLLISESSEFFAELMDISLPDRWGDWVFDLFGDMDVVTWLYSDFYVDEDNEYHFRHWKDRVFYVE